MVRRLLDAVDVVLEGGVTPGVVLLLLNKKNIGKRQQALGTDITKKKKKSKQKRSGKEGNKGGGGGLERGGRNRLTIAVAE